MKNKHGLNQYRINHAKDYAKMFAEKIVQIELMFQLSVKDQVDEDVAEKFISSSIDELDEEFRLFKSYIDQRSDLK